MSWSIQVWRILLEIPLGLGALFTSGRWMTFCISSLVMTIGQWCVCGYITSLMSSRSAFSSDGKKTTLSTSTWSSNVWAIAPWITSGGNLGRSCERWLSVLVHLTSFHNPLESLQTCLISILKSIRLTLLIARFLRLFTYWYHVQSSSCLIDVHTRRSRRVSLTISKHSRVQKDLLWTSYRVQETASLIILWRWSWISVT